MQVCVCVGGCVYGLCVACVLCVSLCVCACVFCLCTLENTAPAGLMMFTVVLLVGTGWSLVKVRGARHMWLVNEFLSPHHDAHASRWQPFLHDREKKVAMVIIPMQVRLWRWQLRLWVRVARRCRGRGVTRIYFSSGSCSQTSGTLCQVSWTREPQRLIHGCARWLHARLWHPYAMMGGDI